MNLLRKKRYLKTDTFVNPHFIDFLCFRYTWWNFGTVNDSSNEKTGQARGHQIAYVINALLDLSFAQYMAKDSGSFKLKVLFIFYNLK